jgi:hypothetical protein
MSKKYVLSQMMEGHVWHSLTVSCEKHWEGPDL